MDSDLWRTVLIVALGVNAALGFGYRVYRLTRGGPMSDVIGQAILGLLLAGLAAGVALDSGWVRWVALGYAATFGLIVMPLWVLAVLIPLRPEAPDYAFTAVYWTGLGVIALSALAL